MLISLSVMQTHSNNTGRQNQEISLGIGLMLAFVLANVSRRLSAERRRLLRNPASVRTLGRAEPSAPPAGNAPGRNLGRGCCTSRRFPRLPVLEKLLRLHEWMEGVCVRGGRGGQVGGVKGKMSRLAETVTACIFTCDVFVLHRHKHDPLNHAGWCF